MIIQDFFNIDTSLLNIKPNPATIVAASTLTPENG